jgi:hypothetical protein
MEIPVRASSLSPILAAWLSAFLLSAAPTTPNRTPRQAAQEGIEWLQTAATAWQQYNSCYGCHVQAQVIMGLAVAKHNSYVIDDRSLQELVKFVGEKQEADGSLDKETGTQFAAMALAYYDELTGARTPALLKSVKWLLTQQQPSGEIPCSRCEAPIDQGNFMTTANSSLAFMQAFRETGDFQFQRAAERGLNWIASTKPESTQDKVFVVLALSRYGTPAQKKIARAMVNRLRAEQTKEGGWREISGSTGPNAFATGQVLYAFKQAGVPIDLPEFERGVQYLMATQTQGFWPLVNSQSGQPSNFAPTMWAVIGLAGSFQPAGQFFFTTILGVAGLGLIGVATAMWRGGHERNCQRRLRQRGFAVRAEGEIRGGPGVDYRADLRGDADPEPRRKPWRT